MATGFGLIGLDWGTTNLRAYKLGLDGVVLDSRTSAAGVSSIVGEDRPAAFESAVVTLCGDWLAESPRAPLVAAGMVGSTRGWRDAGYRTLPVALDKIAEDPVTVSVAGRPMTLLPGVMGGGPSPGVMRGEETQLLGIGDLEQGEAIVLPGTHSKWVTVQDRLISEFETYLTGEVFALLAEASILSEFCKAGVESGDAFARGVRTALEARADLLRIVFSARALVLTHQLPAEEARDYLSGLVIGSELASPLVQARRRRSAGLVIVGAGGVTEAYRRAATLAGWTRVRAVAEATPQGLYRSAELLGLLGGPRGESQ